MFANIDDYVTDENMEVEGVDLSFGKGRFITIRRAGGSNAKFSSYVASKLRENDISVTGSAMDDDKAKGIMYDAYSKLVVLDWRGWLDEKGKAIPFSQENCLALFNSSREIYEHVVTQANTLDNFRANEVKESGNE